MTYDQVLEYTEKLSCSIKTFCAAWRTTRRAWPTGGRFTPFKCECFGYQPSERAWRTDVAAWHLKTDDERAAARKVHRGGGDDELNTNKQHCHQELFMPPQRPTMVWTAAVPTISTSSTSTSSSTSSLSLIHI